MSVFLSDAFKSGKTYAALNSSWATMEDQIKLCALANGRKSTMKNAHNYTPALLPYIDGLQPCKDPVTLSKVELLRKRGHLFHFSNGSYICSRLVSIPEKKDVFLFDIKGQQIDNANDVAFIYYKIDGKLSTWINGWTLASDSIIEFDGFPYIRLNESATPAPKKILYPKYLGAVRRDPVITRVLQRFADDLALNDSWAQLDGLLLGSTDSATASIILSWAMGNVDENGYVSLKNGEKISRNKMIKIYGALMRAVSARTINPTDVGESFDHIILPNEEDVYTAVRSIEGIIFNTTRCFIDSVSSMVYGGEGATLSHGVDGNFMGGLQGSTESEAILIYTPHGKDGEDPLDYYDLGGYVDGFIYVDENNDESRKPKWLSDRDWFITSRNEQAGNRDSLYRMIWHRNGETLVFGNRTYYCVETKKIIPYSNKSEFSGRFDDRLKIESLNGLRRLEPGSVSKAANIDSKKGTVRRKTIYEPIPGGM